MTSEVQPALDAHLPAVSQAELALDLNTEGSTNIPKSSVLSSQVSTLGIENSFLAHLPVLQPQPVMQDPETLLVIRSKRFKNKTSMFEVTDSVFVLRTAILLF